MYLIKLSKEFSKKKIQDIYNGFYQYDTYAETLDFTYEDFVKVLGPPKNDCITIDADCHCGHPHFLNMQETWFATIYCNETNEEKCDIIIFKGIEDEEKEEYVSITFTDDKYAQPFLNFMNKKLQNSSTSSSSEFDLNLYEENSSNSNNFEV